MIKQKVGTLIGGAALALCLLPATGQDAQAGQLYKGWNYGIDAAHDGSGGSDYDIGGFAVKETGDSLFFALTGGTALTGVDHDPAADGNIGWGDLFLNFSGKDYKTAQAEGNLFGIRFAGTNDSGAPQVGLYSNVTAKSVTSTNDGHKSLKDYADTYHPNGSTDMMGTDLSSKEDAYAYLYGDDVAANPTHQNTRIQNVIDTGNFLGGLDLLDSTQLAAAGLDFGNFGADGPHTFGFKIDKSLLKGVLLPGLTPFMAHILLECGNDGVALAGNLNIPGNPTEVPEPFGLLGLGFAGLALLGQRKRQQGKASA